MSHQPPGDDPSAAAGPSQPSAGGPAALRAVISGAASGAGRACAHELRRLGFDLVLCDNDGPALRDLAAWLGGIGRFCDVASESSVSIFAADLTHSGMAVNLLVNAGGGSYVRSLGMMRMSRALMPVLKRADGEKLIVNLAPRAGAAPELFPRAGSLQSFCQLSEALASQTRGSTVRVVTVTASDPEVAALEVASLAAALLPGDDSGRLAG